MTDYANQIHRGWHSDRLGDIDSSWWISYIDSVCDHQRRQERTWHIAIPSACRRIPENVPRGLQKTGGSSCGEQWRRARQTIGALKKGAGEVQNLLILLVTLWAMFGCAPGNPGEKLGVQIASIRLTGAEHFIDLRYRILDPEKASTLLDRNEQLFLFDQATGTSHPVTRNKLGPMRASGSKPEAQSAICCHVFQRQ